MIFLGLVIILPRKRGRGHIKTYGHNPRYIRKKSKIGTPSYFQVVSPIDRLHLILDHFFDSLVGSLSLHSFIELMSEFA